MKIGEIDKRKIYCSCLEILILIRLSD